jgi:hypothetical protein
MGPRLRLAAVLGIACCELACGPYIDEVNAQHGQKVEPKLLEIAKVRKRLEATPALSQDKAPAGSLRIVLSDSWSVKGNAALLYAEDFTTFDELGFVYARLPDADLVQRGAAALHTEHKPWDPARPEATPAGAFGSDASRAYALIEALEFVAVLRTVSFAKPQIGLSKIAPAATTPPDAGVPTAVPAAAGSADGGGVEKYAYSGGYLSAELHFFRVAGAEWIGGVRFEAESSETLKGVPSDVALEQDLRKNIASSLKAALAKHAPNAQVADE